MHSQSVHSYFSGKSTSKYSHHGSTASTTGNTSLEERWSSQNNSKHEKPKDGSSHTSRQSESYLCYDVPAKARSPFAIKYQWDGKTSSFEKYEKMIEGHLLQVGAGYLVDDYFLQKYDELHGEYFIADEFWLRYGFQSSKPSMTGFTFMVS